MAAALLIIGVPGATWADGYNDWAAEPAPAGDVIFVPATQWRLSAPALSYDQLQLQIGLSDRADLIITAAAWLGRGERTMDGTMIQPRVLLAPGWMLSPGINVQGSVDGTPGSWLPALYWTGERGRWGCNVNLLSYIPFGAPGDAQHYTVLVVQRKLRDDALLYAEADLTGPYARLGTTTVDVSVGAQVEVGVHTFNLNLMLPGLPSPTLSELRVGLWWAFSVTVDPLGRE